MTAGVAEKGRAFLLKHSNQVSPVSYVTVAGLRTTGLTINGEAVDVTSKDDAGWQVLLADAGQKSVTISAAGVFKDTAVEALLRTAAINQSMEDFQLIFENGDYFAGNFQITTLEYTGENNQGTMFSMTMQSSGPVVFTAI